MAIRTTNCNGASFFEKGVDRQVYARSIREAKAQMTFSCNMCKGKECAGENCSIAIAHEVAMERLNKKALRFIESALRKQDDSYTIGYATRSFEYSCEKCKNGLWRNSCEGCPVKEKYEKNLRTLR